MTAKPFQDLIPPQAVADRECRTTDYGYPWKRIVKKIDYRYLITHYVYRPIKCNTHPYQHISKKSRLR